MLKTAKEQSCKAKYAFILVANQNLSQRAAYGENIMLKTDDFVDEFGGSTILKSISK